MVKLIWRMEDSHGLGMREMAEMLEGPLELTASTIRGLLGDWRRGLSLPVLLKKDRAQKLAEISGYPLTDQDFEVIEQYRKWLEGAKSGWETTGDRATKRNPRRKGLARVKKLPKR